MMTSLIFPAAALAAITGVVYLVSTIAASVDLRRRAAIGAAPTTASDAPDWLELPRRNYNSLLRMPVLFYAAIALDLARDGGDLTQVRLAWAYVGVRVLHSLGYMTLNSFWVRLCLLSASAAVLLAMWARLVVSVL